MSGLEHYEVEISAIETRITRLAIACGVDASSRQQIDAVKSGNFVLCTSGNEHTHRLLQELLQLLDYITMHCANERGVEECRKIIEQVEARLRHHNFGD